MVENNILTEVVKDDKIVWVLLKLLLRNGGDCNDPGISEI